MNLLPMGHRVLIKEIIEDNKTESGILLGATDSVDDVVRGVVVAVGSKVKDVLVGTTVLFQLGYTIQVGTNRMIEDTNLEAIVLDDILPVA